jgi:HSP20 family molecular chaperone IbpA
MWTTIQNKSKFRKNENGYSAYLILPEFDKNDIKIEIDGNYLNITAKRENNIFNDEIYRSIYIDDVKYFNIDSITAELKNGILKIDIPYNKDYQKKSLIKIS